MSGVIIVVIARGVVLIVIIVRVVVVIVIIARVVAVSLSVNFYGYCSFTYNYSIFYNNLI